MTGSTRGVLSVPILKLSGRSLFGRGRALLLAILPILLVALALLLRNADIGPADARTFLSTFGIGMVIPVVVLICTTTLINSEFDDGSILYLLIKPVSRTAIIASKTLVMLVGALLCGALAIVLGALVLDGGEHRMPLAGLVGGVVAAFGYTGLFAVLSTLLKRSILGCLAYWLVWESILVPLISAAKWLSVRAWSTAAMEEISTAPVRGEPAVPLTYALIAAVVVLALGVVTAAVRLRSVTLSEE